MHHILIVGVGSIGHRHLRCFQNTGRAQISLCDTNQALGAKLAQQYGITRLHSDLDIALNDNPDAVVICTPAHLHIDMATRAATSGAALLIEKPLSTTTDGLEQFRAVLTENNILCSIAYVMRHHPVLIDIKNVVASGRFGKPLQLTLTSGQHFPYYRPAYREIYYTDHATGGGAIQDAITHMMNATQWLLGPVSSLVCDAGHQALEGVTVEDTVHVLTRHGQTMGSLTLNQFQYPNETTLSIIFERGSIRCDLHDNTWYYCAEIAGGWNLGAEHHLERDDLFERQAAHFLDVLEGREQPSCTLDAAVHTLHTNLAMLSSNNDKQWYHIP